MNEAAMFEVFNSTLKERESKRSFDKDLWQKSLKLISPSIEFFNEKAHFNFALLHDNLVALATRSNDNGVNLSIVAHLFGGLFPLIKFGSEKQNSTYLQHLFNGTLIAALAYTDDKSKEVLCHKNHNGDYELNGTKKYITNATVADIFIVYAKTNNGRLNAFIVEKNHLGLTIDSNLELSGLKTSPIGHVSFKNCIISSESLLGKEGDGQIVFNSSIDKERIFVISLIYGRLGYLKNYFLKMVKEKSVQKHYPYVETVALSQNAILRTECLILQAISILEKGQNAFMISAQIKSIVPGYYQKVCLKMIQALGADGLNCSLELERELRDSLASSLYSGSTEVLNTIISKLSKLN